MPQILMRWDASKRLAQAVADAQAAHADLGPSRPQTLVSRSIVVRILVSLGRIEEARPIAQANRGRVDGDFPSATLIIRRRNATPDGGRAPRVKQDITPSELTSIFAVYPRQTGVVVGGRHQRFSSSQAQHSDSHLKTRDVSPGAEQTLLRAVVSGPRRHLSTRRL